MLRASFMLGSLLLIAGASTGQEEKKKPLPPIVAELLKATPEEILKRFDKNGDGVLDRDEAPPILAKSFDKADRDGNGKLDRTEIGGMLQVMRGMLGAGAPGDSERFVDNLLQQFDTNKDGKIARAEAKARLADGFDRTDTNKDGVLDRGELRALAQRVMQFQKGPGGGFQPKQAGVDFDALDKNADGRLSRAELAGTPFAQRYAEIDADTSGSIDRREFEGYLKKQAAK